MARFLQLLLAISPAVSLARPSASESCQTCKTVPESAGWPSLVEWHSLNQSVSGRLLAPLPPAIVCDPSRKSTFNKVACAEAGKAWTNPLFHSSDPVSLQSPNFQDDGCLPTAIYNASTRCHTKPFSHYVVNASKAEHVVEALKFANDKGVRLSIKGTGHDFLGRSAGRGLEIWTHNIRGIEIIPKFKPTSCRHCSGTSAIKIFAGEVFGPVYTLAKKHGVIPVVGADGTVGIGGYLLGGGHSPIGTKYGLAVDHALEIQAVTPLGEVVTANDHQNQDLFWALKGGGGSTFGVLISATLKTFPKFPISQFSVKFSSTKREARQNNNTNFYSALADLHMEIPSLANGNLTGYSAVGPTALLTGKPITNPEILYNGPQLFVLTGWGLDRTEEATKDVLRPLWEKLNATHGIECSVQVSPQSDVYSAVGVSSGGSSSSSGDAYSLAGINLLVASRLWDKKALSNKTSLISTFRSLQPGIFTGLMISGPGVQHPARPHSTSVTPAWRRTYLHITTGVNWPYRNHTVEKAAVARNNNVLTKVLRDQAPDMGCYLNEANVMQPDFQQAFWGDNYPRLLKLKHRFDPNGVLYCHACVGSEEWVERKNGEVCRK